MAEVIHRHKYEGRTRGRKETALAAELTRERAAAVRANRLRSEMLLARQRGELIEKALVQRQATWLLIAFRQAVLSIPQAYSRQLVGITDVQEMSAKLRAMALSLLEELEHLPEKATNPNWLEQLEEEGA